MINGEAGEPQPVEVTGVPLRGPHLQVPLPFQPPPPPAGTPARPRRAGRVVTGVLLAGAVAAGLFLTSPRERATPAAATAASATASPAAQKSQPPTPRELVDRALAAQNRALLAGDPDGYLAVVDEPLHEWYRMRFASLRALGVAKSWSQARDAPELEPDGQWSTLVESVHCFGTTECRLRERYTRSTWTVRAGRAVLTAAERSAAPWDTTALQAVTGRRVIVAAPAKYAGRLAATLTTADRSADIADRFAHWGSPPDRYVLYLAGAAEWKTWFGGEADDAADAYAHDADVVQRADHGVIGLGNLLTHEFTHVVSLERQAEKQVDWWLVEGLAEYAADRDGSWTRDRLPFVRRYVKQGRWDGSVALGPIPEHVSDNDWYARYGIALLTVTRLAQRFGEPAMLDFFATVVHDGTSPEVAAPAAFGTDWAAVAADCAAHIRSRTR